MTTSQLFLRLFIALPIPEAVKAAGSELQTELRNLLPGDGVRWPRPDQFHLTLKFLGLVESQYLESLTSATRQACHDLKRFAVHAAQMGCFPAERRPRVLSLGIQSETSDLRILHERIEWATARFAQKEESREFHPHVTLARINHIPPVEARALAEFISSTPRRVLGKWTADQVEIIRSELHPEGSLYTCQATIPLAG